MTLYENYQPPVAIGGIGGSGTRLIAEILKNLGFFIGSDLNNSNDNLWFTLLFKRVELVSQHADRTELFLMISLFYNAMLIHRPFNHDEKNIIERISSEDRLQHPASWLKERSESMLNAVEKDNEARTLWGWKEPNTHIFLDFLEAEIPGLKYIHVIRHGLDMAHSSNQNQLKLWGPLLLGPEYADVTPHNSLKFWCYAHRRVIRLGEKMGNRFLLLNYDELCSRPEKIVPDLISFFDLKPELKVIEEIFELIAEPKSVGRYQKFGLDIYDPVDVEYVKQLGFIVEDK